MKPTRPLLRALSMEKYSIAITDDEHRIRQMANINCMQDKMDETHKQISEKVTTERTRQKIAHNQKCGIVPIKFQEGDFVLVKRPQRKDTN